MAFSIQTNLNSLIAQENLRVNSDFQSRTINRLTSGFRINQSGDDAAGLAIANKYRSDAAELTQGVRNANDGISTLQIVDGGMNNVSKMLDRLKTLATQSASGTFTGDRAVLNNEFNTLLGEIDRQAQAIGLNQNGQFAKTLSVFVGGGRTNTGAVDIDNGSVTINLSNSTVDTNSLGLKGYQAVGGTEDIGSGSSTHTVFQIVSNVSNTTAVGGYSDFYFSGPGFADSGKVKVSVNVQNVSDTDSLVRAINAGIDAAAGAGTQEATQFKNANIKASVHTDSSGGKQIAFTSNIAAFQVQAGDRMANALLGNFSGGSTGAAVSSSVSGYAASAATTTVVNNPTGITVRFTGGGLSQAVSITLKSSSATIDDAITDIRDQVAGNAALQAAGINMTGITPGGNLAFTSAQGEQFEVQVTGDAANRLGFGTFMAGDAGEFDYARSTGVAYNRATAYGTAQLEFSINGAASNTNQVAIALGGGDATAATITGTAITADPNGETLTFAVDGGAVDTIVFGAGVTTMGDAVAAINAAGKGITATIDGAGHMVLSSNTKGANSALAITPGGAATTLGLLGSAAGQSRTVGSVVDALNAAFAADPQMQAAGLNASYVGTTITVASTNGTQFRMNAGGSGANANIGFGVAGVASFTGQTVAASAMKTVDAGGAYNSTVLDFSALAYGSDDQAITVTANDATGNMHSKTITLRNDATGRTGRSLNEALHAINEALQQTNDTTLQRIVAVKEVSGGAEKINFISAVPNFKVSLGTTANSDGFSDGGTFGAMVDAEKLGGGATVDISSQTGAQEAVRALTTAVSTLGQAQAAVGKAQNQLSYALGLAQSQMSNFAAAESRIRDADIAAEAANLTKAQVLQQASLAAMAQANSAPQAVLALLRG